MNVEIILAKHAGFCFGVRRAIDLALAAADSKTSLPIRTLGPLIHNPQVVQELEGRGLQAVDHPDEMKSGVLIIRCHGVPPRVKSLAESAGLEVLDATCPFVCRSMQWAKAMKDEGYRVVIVGDRDHPEVVAVSGAVEDEALVVSDPEAVRRLPAIERAGVVAQTTQVLSNYQACVAALMEKSKELKVYDTICTATSQRQEAADDLSRRASVILVIGGKNSANTTRLFRICADKCPRTYHIETETEIDPEWFEPSDLVGVTAGASTPNRLIEGVVRRMREIAEKMEQDVAHPVGPQPGIDGVNAGEASTAGTAGVSHVESADDQTGFAGESGGYEQTLKTLSPGDVVRGKVVHVGSDEILVDIGYKSEGRIPVHEIGLKSGQVPSDVASPGDELDVHVLKVEDDEGSVLLSKKRADNELTWRALEEAHQAGKVLQAKVTERVKGGLLVDVGLRGFVPASHVERNYVENLDKFVGDVLRLKVLELDRSKNNVVLSRKEVLEEDYARAKAETFASLKEGQVVQGEVRRLTDFGAFVDIGSGVEGLLHVSEMAWSRVRHPSDVLREGEPVKVMVLNVDRQNERISLGHKQVLPNPWDTVDKRYQVGQVVSGEVTRVVDFGAFVRVEEGIEGLVHVSQLSDRRVAKPQEVVSQGDKVDAKIVSIDQQARRIGLSIRELLYEVRPVKPQAEAPARKPEEPEQPNGATIGELCEGLSSLLLDRREAPREEAGEKVAMAPVEDGGSQGVRNAETAGEASSEDDKIQDDHCLGSPKAEEA